MKGLDDLLNRIRKGEGKFLEFKKKTDHPDKIVRELVAFANSGGGVLLIGVDDNGSISGLRFPEEDQYVMEAALHRYAKPIPDVAFSRIKVSGKNEILQLTVSAGRHKPYYWLKDKDKGQYRVYVRSADKCLQATREHYQILKSPPRDELHVLQIEGPGKLLFQSFANREYIGMPEVLEMPGMSRKKASKLIVDFVRMGILWIEPHEDGDRFHLAAKYRTEEI
jgi:hypothetical protein